MPCLVHEVGVAGDRVDLASNFLELGVVAGQILKFSGAHEGEVGRVEEEQGPVAEHISLVTSWNSLFWNAFTLKSVSSCCRRVIIGPFADCQLSGFCRFPS